MDEKLYIPMGVKTETEIFPGFGRREFLQSVVGSLGAGVLALLVWIISRNVTPSVICILSGIVGSVMMTTKDQTNLSVVDQVWNMVSFMRGQKYYHYAYGDEWRVGK